MLTGSTMCKYIDGYFCDNVYPEFSYSTWRMGIFASSYNNGGHDSRVPALCHWLIQWVQMPRQLEDV